MGALIKKNNLVTLCISSILLCSCSQDLRAPGEAEAPLSRDQNRKRDFGQFFGTDFLLFGSSKKPSVSGTLSPRVNKFLWQGTLDVLSFLPLICADAAGGVVISEWYSNPKTPQERIKVTVYILDSALRAEALRVLVHKQVKIKTNEWVNADVTPTIVADLENIILSKARQLRVKSLNG